MALADTFNRHDGSLEGYSLNTVANPLASRRHYNLRTFDNTGLIIP